MSAPIFSIIHTLPHIFVDLGKADPMPCSSGLAYTITSICILSFWTKKHDGMYERVS